MSRLLSTPRWCVHLPTVAETTVRLAVPTPRSDREPWAAARALSEVIRLGGCARAPADALGAGRGVPVVSRHHLDWHGVAVTLEAWHHRDGGPGEVMLAMPPWDELVRADLVEEQLWELVDAVAAAVDALHGAITDAEAGAMCTPRPGRLGRYAHRQPALLVPDTDLGLPPADLCRYRVLPLSGLVVLIH